MNNRAICKRQNPSEIPSKDNSVRVNHIGLNAIHASPSYIA